MSEPPPVGGGSDAKGTAPVRVLWQAHQPDGTVLVTFALPGLRRHSVRVPYAVWLNGGHLVIGAHAHKTLDAFLPPPKPDGIDPP